MNTLSKPIEKWTQNQAEDLKFRYEDLTLTNRLVADGNLLLAKPQYEFISFSLDCGGVAGRIVVKESKLYFEGDVDASARIFADTMYGKMMENFLERDANDDTCRFCNKVMKLERKDKSWRRRRTRVRFVCECGVARPWRDD